MGTGAFFGRVGGRLTGIALAVYLACTGAGAADPTCSEDTVFLRGDWGRAQFTVELADDAEERATGLMNRDSMSMSAGMYFVYDRPHRASFWMRNTLIPLDMLFIDATGVVRHIHHEAVPLDETPINGGEDVLTVLEINGGLARRLGITEGSEVRHPAHAEWSPSWPC